MTGRRALSAVTACLSAVVVASCNSQTHSPSTALAVPSPIVDHHAADVPWSTVVPRVLAGWQMTHTPEDLTLKQAQAIFPSGSHLASELSFAGFRRGVHLAVAG